VPGRQRPTSRRWAAAVGLWVGLAPPSLTAAEEPLFPQEAWMTPATTAAIDRGLAFLQQRQRADGSWADKGSGRNVAVCSLAAFAFLASGSTPGRGPHGTAVQRAVDYVASCADPQTGIVVSDDTLGRGPMYGHGFAALLLCEVSGMSRTPQLRARTGAATEAILRAQNDAGGWRYTPEPRGADLSVTACQVMALRAARNAGIAVPKEAIDRATAYLRGCQNADGGFRYMIDQGDPRSSFARSAAALAALYAAGIHEGPEIEAAASYVAGFVPGRPGAEPTPYYYYGHYYAIQAMWFLGGEHWSRWYPAIRDELLARQLQDGSWSDPMVGKEYATAIACIVLQTPNNYLPLLQR